MAKKNSNSPFLNEHHSMIKISSEDFHENLLTDTNNPAVNHKFNRDRISAQNKEEIKNLNLSRYYGTVSNIFYCFSLVTLKFMEKTLPNYNISMMVGFRFIFFGLSAFCFIKKFNRQVPDVWDIKEKKWYVMRIITHFLGLVTYKMSIDYIRIGLSLSLAMLSPLWGNFFSIYFFKEKFELKYLFGCITCLFGNYLIGLGEDKGKEAEITFSTLIGITYGVANSFLTAGINMSSKLLLTIYGSYELNFLLGIHVPIFSFFLAFVQYDKILYTLNIQFILLTALNGMITFFAFHFLNLSFSLAPFNKISYIGYTQIVFSLVLGLIFFGESLNFLDLVGSVFIIGYNVFSSKYLS